jgi:hypothetical protein
MTPELIFLILWNTMDTLDIRDNANNREWSLIHGDVC